MSEETCPRADDIPHRSNGCLTADAILGVHDRTVERVDVPEWGGHIYVRTLGAGERDFLARQCRPDAPYHDMSRALVVAKVACRADGTRLFEDYHATALNEKSTVPVQRIFEAADRLNGFTDEAIEETAKNSETAQSDSSPSD